nr:hypothetical protein [Clostridioides sp.]
MKKIIKMIICLILVISIPVNIFSAGEGNVDGGGGGMGGGTSTNKWTPGDEGVRVTVVDDKNKKVVGTPIDFSNKVPNIKYHFGNTSKIHYKNGYKLELYHVNDKSYKCYAFDKKIPIIITSQQLGTSDMKKIKSFFCSEPVIRRIAELKKLNYEVLINGDYKLLMEPIAYVTFNGNRIAMTAHEASLYNEKLNGGLRSKLVSITHKNLPLSMFLETPDLGFPAWKGSTNNKQTDKTIQERLGLGIVYFNNFPDGETDGEVDIKPPESGGTTDPDNPDETYNYDYHTDTDVVTSIKVSGSNRSPNNPVEVTFNIKGKTYTKKNIYLPKQGGSQLVWVKWHTPKTPEKITITAKTNTTVKSIKINANIVDLKEKTPPDPTANDRNDTFINPKIPNPNNKTSAEFGEWDCKWISHWVFYSDGEGGGSWVDEGWWEWSWIKYTVNLSASMNAKADDKVITASEDKKTIKSGYGIIQNLNTSVNFNAPSDSFTMAQNAISYYPEFTYKDFNRVFEFISNSNNSKFELKKNKYSTYNQKTHFTPIWYKDGKYTPYARIIDVWTPTGMLQVEVNDSINIKGNLFQDYHIGPMKN